MQPRRAPQPAPLPGRLGPGAAPPRSLTGAPFIAVALTATGLASALVWTGMRPHPPIPRTPVPAAAPAPASTPAPPPRPPLRPESSAAAPTPEPIPFREGSTRDRIAILPPSPESGPGALLPRPAAGTPACESCAGSPAPTAIPPRPSVPLGAARVALSSGVRDIVKIPVFTGMCDGYYGYSVQNDSDLDWRSVSAWSYEETWPLGDIRAGQAGTLKSSKPLDIVHLRIGL